MKDIGAGKQVSSQSEFSITSIKLFYLCLLLEYLWPTCP